VALTLWAGGASADSRECRASKALLDLGNPLEIARTALVDERELRIVAMGSSSTQGYGTTNPQFAYPFQLKMKLEAALPGVAIHVFNKGIGGQDAEEMTARMRTDVKPERAHLVIWQVGTNSAIKRVPIDQFARRLRAGIDIGKSLGANFVLMNLQLCSRRRGAARRGGYARVAATWPEAPACSVVSTSCRICLQRRHALLAVRHQRRPHLNDFGQKCIGKLLSVAIIDCCFETSGAPTQPN
jgi:hypothetical protein